mmetsp:Transcript_41938/g.64581  ORF Transcript_41938/g.64581 Transcript_41938/m.64581 type:complete len:213 (-) Transcript_41938:103-741(-)|eukprot:CAMPEP_0117081600 /NCGR_PEP_ID=MMETSP0472-20121206/57491_1 /TAXON_ID=693140 ORGANISM="Tiarina fusus, Strain LIS" /NCGR_SAMPLE_ID=MMETSP0472 /ASSEMBLY_ACC=CAM_ASM_000603 /LENGTH=212 /DNA_ID=CAMNT_0004809553 /DNA_START=171 /DNA_END=809 /DNA_ORIENTATION=-
MLAKPPIAIQPQIAMFTVILTAVCAYGAYSEKYVRNPDGIDERIKKKYLADMQDAQAKMPQLTETIRGKDMKLDSRMNKLVWGGKANLEQAKPPSKPSSSSSSSGPADDWDDEDDDYSSSSGSSSSSSEAEDDTDLTPEEAAKKRERRARRKEQKRRKRERGGKKRSKKKKKKQVDEASAAEKKLVAQSMAAGVALGAVAMAATFLMSSRRK